MARTEPPKPSGDFLTRKLGPLPMYAWILAGTAGAYLFTRMRPSASTSAAASAASPTNGTATSGTPSLTYTGGTYGTPDQSNALMESFLSILASQGQTAASPGNSGGPTVSPGNTGNPGIQPQPVNPANFPLIAAPGTAMETLGTITAPGQFSGFNVGGNAPQYANIGGQWQQDFSWKSLPVGTQIGTPQTFDSYIAKNAGPALVSVG